MDPVTSWKFPLGLPDRARLISASFRVTARMLLTHGGQVAASPNYDTLAVWSPPGTPALSDDQQAEYLRELAAASGSAGDRATALMHALEANHPADLPPHYHVMWAAARPSARNTPAGFGVIRALARAANADRAGVYAEASSAANVELWQRVGLRRIGPEIRLPDGGPSLYPLWGGHGEWAI